MAAIDDKNLEQDSPPWVAGLLQIDDTGFDMGTVVHEPGQIDILGPRRIADHDTAPFNANGFAIIWIIGLAG
jgi:hypothetical protein